jgi:hypothetical protein
MPNASHNCNLPHCCHIPNKHPSLPQCRKKVIFMPLPKRQRYDEFTNVTTSLAGSRGGAHTTTLSHTVVEPSSWLNAKGLGRKLLLQALCTCMCCCDSMLRSNKGADSAPSCLTCTCMQQGLVRGWYTRKCAPIALLQEHMKGHRWSIIRPHLQHHMQGSPQAAAWCLAAAWRPPCQPLQLLQQRQQRPVVLARGRRGPHPHQ